MRKSVPCLTGLMVIGCLLAGGIARADDDRSSACRDLPSHAALKAQLEARPSRRPTADSTWTCGPPSSIATASSAPSRSRATTAAINGPAAG